MSTAPAASDQWFFEIGDGQVYGPYTLEKLQKWAAAGNLMPTHRVRRADSSEWIIAAYIPGLELTTAAPAGQVVAEREDPEAHSKLASLARTLGLKGKGDAKNAGADLPDVIEFCDQLLETALERGASDLHIDPEESFSLVQLRVDGQLEPLRKLPIAIHGAVIGRFKILAKMDIAERRMAQDGQFLVELGEPKRRISIRAATLPTTHGERITLRLLAVEIDQLTLNKLGMSAEGYKMFAGAAAQQQGLVLLSGPTGAGKSTTLYAALRHRLAYQPGRIITVEEPVEYDMVGVAQIEVDSSDRVKFETVLRNILRSDPDVIMIGEIRDLITADVAIKAALTGHLVFSTVHANSAAGVVTRLVDMGIAPYQAAATLRLAVGQRLVRRLCQKFRVSRPLSEGEAAAIGRPEAVGRTVYGPGRCAACNDRGFKGRVGVFEMIPIDAELARMVVAGGTEGDVARYARQCKHPSLQEDASLKLLSGMTTLEELNAAGAM